MHIHTHTHTNSPTITPPSLSYFLFPCCFSMLSLSLVKLLTCGVIRSYNFASANVFSPLFQLKWPGITYFWNMGKMEFPPETFKISHTIAFHANLVLLSSRMVFFMPAGPCVKLFWYVKAILNGVGSIRIHWEGVKGQHYIESFSHTGCQKIIVLQGCHRRTPWFDILHFGRCWFKPGVISNLCAGRTDFFWQEPVPWTMHVPEENSAWVTNTMKPTFHLDQVFAFF